MRIHVVEFEVTCPVHGRHRTTVPVELPRPRHCLHCYLPATERREVTRRWVAASAPQSVGGEAFVG